MPNPYDDLFDNPLPEKKAERVDDPQPDQLPVIEPVFSLDDNFDPDGPDALDEILALNAEFNGHAEQFSKILSKLRVVDHEVKGKVTRLFFVSKDPHQRGSMAGEKQYHALQTEKFSVIIEPMRKLAELHLNIVKQFNRDIDDLLFSLASCPCLVGVCVNVARVVIALSDVLHTVFDRLSAIGRAFFDVECGGQPGCTEDFNARHLE